MEPPTIIRSSASLSVFRDTSEPSNQSRRPSYKNAEDGAKLNKLIGDFIANKPDLKFTRDDITFCIDVFHDKWVVHAPETPNQAFGHFFLSRVPRSDTSRPHAAGSGEPGDISTKTRPHEW